MFRILYAAGNSYSSKIQLTRFLEAMKDKPYLIKTAAYRKSSPTNYNIDWTLDCILNIYRPSAISDDFKLNDNLSIYFEQVKRFNPDLIISDLEYFTSYIANVLNINIWQCSPILIKNAVSFEQKYNLGEKFYKIYFDLETYNSRLTNIITNSNCNLIYSHFGDLKRPPPIKDKFEWIRPYHYIGKYFPPCKHNIISGSLNSNKSIYQFLGRHNDSIAFTEHYDEQYSNVVLKDINDKNEYICNLHNSNLFVCEGQGSFLADAFYNNKYSIIMLDSTEVECIINHLYSSGLGLSKTIYASHEDISECFERTVEFKYSDNVKFLHEKIEEIL